MYIVEEDEEEETLKVSQGSIVLSDQALTLGNRPSRNSQRCFS